ncbi:NlpC/P60 family protein [Streptomyces sp. NBC_01210]|uniref:C40 family peptidase n=1 Tax=Streptomyces sp. NBC_01210 TaxID=2903774 RepID=UPI002E130E5B|nr:NlpC/P60 family protein [Streptomyces sp. NBC_01210]
MTGHRCRTTAAVALVCAITVTAQGAAFAVPTPEPRPDRPTSLGEVRKELDRLYHDAEVATDAYNTAEEKAEEQSNRVTALAEDVAKGEKRLEELKSRAGAAARAQYRSGGLPPEAHLFLSDDPQQVLNDVSLARQVQQGTMALLVALTTTQKDLREKARDASDQLRKLEASRTAQANAQTKIEERISAAEKLESRLKKQELERILAMERQTGAEAQSTWLSSGIIKDIKGEASAQGEKAIAYASLQIGKPYEWGAEGPNSFDCSGLTSEAWAAAKRPIPRTSQEQWRQLARIDIKDMRPGDLIIYHRDASHVGMYIGDGSIVHAPRPGRNVTVADAGSMQILGVVRPDK